MGGLAILLRSAVYGTAVVIQERFDPQQATATLAEGGASLVSLVPTMLARLLDAGLRDPPSLRAALVGGAGAPSSLLERAAGAGLPVVRTYGMTETASQVATAREGEPGAAPLPGAEITVAPGGEVLARGPMVAAGSIADDGWLHTGDLGRIDGEGRLHLEGRLAETIVTGGENVVAREVEAALLAHPAVTEATVVGEPDPDWGEAVTAYVVARAESEVSPEELSAHCRERLAGFKVPKAVHRLEALPRNAAGKVERGRLSTLI